MRIAISVAAFKQAPDFGGPVMKVALLAEGLVARGHTVTVLTADYGPNRTRVAAGPVYDGGYTAHYLKTLARYRWSPVMALGALRALPWDYDVVHICGIRDGLGYAVMRHAERRRIPFILEPLGMIPAQLRNVALKNVMDAAITKRQFAGARSVVATSDVERRNLESFAVMPRVVIRPNPVAILPVAPTAAPALDDGRAHLVFVGRICRTKGLLNLVRAMAPLANVRLTIAGPDDADGTSEALHELVATLPPGRVTFRDWVTPQERDELIGSSHICVLPSLTENFGNFAVEAASGRRPVIVTRNTGVAEFLGDDALVVEPTVEALRDAIIALVADGPRRESLAARGFARAAELEPSRVAVAQEDIYREALRSSDRDS